MKCPTCSVSLITSCNSERSFWCVKCGTIVEKLKDGSSIVYSPLLIQRCRQFRNTLADPLLLDAWKGLGIAEAIGRDEP